ncbi:MAG: pyrroloquinoline quinone biosynthesis peptide chaperone PqqD [Gammaproteobacteria bacterium]|nr:pyrroloquinoline quinone biosynthesis peptide chaperone PqqD [Gammaproteobacteria bacterium]
MNSEAIPHANTEFSLEEIDDELLLYHPAKTKAVYLNETAALVWQLCDSKRSVAEIVSLLQENYPESETIQSDVEQTLQQLADNGAVDLESGQ